MDPTKPPGIRIVNIILESFVFNKNDALDISKPYEVSVVSTSEVSLTNTGEEGKSRLMVNIVESSDSLFKIEICYILIAREIENQKNMSVKDYLENNAPATLYQFARETVLSMTQKAGIPLVIPPLNLVKATP